MSSERGSPGWSCWRQRSSTKQVETQRMQKEEVLSLEKEEHLNKDACLRVLLRANLMNSLHDTSLKRKLLTDGAADDSGDPNELPKTVQRSSGCRTEAVRQGLVFYPKMLATHQQNQLIMIVGTSSESLACLSHCHCA